MKFLSKIYILACLIGFYSQFVIGARIKERKSSKYGKYGKVYTTEIYTSTSTPYITTTYYSTPRPSPLKTKQIPITTTTEPKPITLIKSKKSSAIVIITKPTKLKKIIGKLTKLKNTIVKLASK